MIVPQKPPTIQYAGQELAYSVVRSPSRDRRDWSAPRTPIIVLPVILLSLLKTEFPARDAPSIEGSETCEGSKHTVDIVILLKPERQLDPSKIETAAKLSAASRAETPPLGYKRLVSLALRVSFKLPALEDAET